MPTVLREDQHELVTVDGTKAVVFGTADTGLLTMTRPLISSGGLRENTSDLVNEDGTAFGTEYLASKTLGFELGVLTDKSTGVADPLRANLDALDAFEAFWTDDRWRKDPWSVAILRSCEGGRISRCYGRPGRYDEQVGTLTRQGYTPVTCEFRLADANWYSDVEESAQVNITAASQPGLTEASLVAPITSLVGDTSTAAAIVSGSKPTWPIIEFYGPIDNPKLTMGDLSVGLTGTVAAGDKITVDTRPWVRSVLRNNSVAVPGMLSMATPPMRKLRLAPGAYTLLFSGTSSTGTAWAKVRWRAARSRP